ncbi:heavy metal sensor histidine kinase [Xylophilus rhododendri]|uniref:Sensor protein n=1 Tax=Xylophilus rhododendri TaxID=2697032 RepID=A0A857J480_9BURK|nr:heavy metal sensor histidine kinase [Xylophilus rhododendri]QHI97665.1 heavy metal sensor histidine kinase [Xylophilus rhododendri]
MASRSIQRSLSWRLALQTLCCLAATSLLIYLVVRHAFDEGQQTEIARHETMIRAMYGHARGDGDWGGLQTELAEFFRTHDEFAVRLTRDGQVFFVSGPDAGSPGWRHELLPVSDKTPELGLRLGIDVRSDRRVLHTLALALVVISLAVSLVVSLTGARLVRRALHPLRALARETRQVGPHVSGQRLDERGFGAEMEPLVHQFNRMLERNEQAYRQLEAFNADVAHELRTPLANLIGEAEVELSKPRGVDELRETLLSNVEEARRLSAIVSDMLFLSRADRGVTARTERIEALSQPVRDVVEFHEALLESKALRVDILGDAEVQADAALIKRAISNLLGNAIRYAEAGSAIRIAIRTRGALTWIEVANQGPAIPEGMGERLFERFFRVDRSRGGPHYGLGLAIVSAIARMHGGQTRAGSEAGSTTVAFSVAGMRG